MEEVKGSSQLLEPWVVIAMLQSTNSMTEKREIIEYESTVGNEELFKGFKWGFSGFTKFGVREIPESDHEDNTLNLDWNSFQFLLERLDNRELTGNAAKNGILRAMQLAGADQWNLWYRLILQKEFRSGFTGKTVNEAVTQDHHRVPVFTCMLAKDSAKHEMHMNGLKVLDVKLDGVRMLVETHPNGHVAQYSREGKDLSSFVGIGDEFRRLASRLKYPVMFDAEVVSQTFKETMRQANRKTAEIKDATLYVFDAVPLIDFQRGICHIGQLQRKQWLAEFDSGFQSDVIEILDYILVDLNTKEGYAKFVEYNKRALKLKLEGIMIKTADAPYVCQRSDDWLKAKPFIELTMLVEGLYEGLNKNHGSLGGIVCTCEYEGHQVKTKVGSGFSDELRKKIWDAGDAVLGLYAEIRADGLSVDKMGNVSLRFPRFKTFRGTVPGELL